MKLHEFAQINEASIFDEHALINTKWTSIEQLRKWLRKHGFKQLNSGVYAEVYAKPNHKRVVKISKHQDVCWIKFATWALKQSSNKYLPNIPWIHFYQDENSGKKFFVTIIERLNRCSPQQIKKIEDPVIAAAIWNHVDMYSRSSRHALDNRLEELFLQHYNTKITSTKQITNLLRKNSAHRFVKTLIRVFGLGKDQCYDDLHDDNIMFRDNGTPVITDPIAEQ